MCGKNVYAMEKVKYDEQIFHKRCFKCQDCHKTLQPLKVAKMSGELFCKDCFKKRFRARGQYDDVTAVIPGTQSRDASRAASKIAARTEAEFKALKRVSSTLISPSKKAPIRFDKKQYGSAKVPRKMSPPLVAERNQASPAPAFSSRSSSP